MTHVLCWVQGVWLSGKGMVCDWVRRVHPFARSGPPPYPLTHIPPPSITNHPPLTGSLNSLILASASVTKVSSRTLYHPSYLSR